MLLIASLNLNPNNKHNYENIIYLFSEGKKGDDAGPDLGGEMIDCKLPGLHCFLLSTERDIREFPSAVLVVRGGPAGAVVSHVVRAQR